MDRFANQLPAATSFRSRLFFISHLLPYLAGYTNCFSPGVNVVQ